MKTVKLTVMVMGIVGLLFGLTPGAWAAEPAPGEQCCLVVNPGSGALALRGTMALVYNWTDRILYVLLRLERSGDQHFFRLHLIGEDLQELDDVSIVCLVLNPKEPSDPLNKRRVRRFVKGILSTFFTGRTPENTRLVITYGSISDAQGVVGCNDPSDEDRDTKLCEIPETYPPRVFTMCDLTIYAVDADRVNFVWPECQFQP